MSNAAYFVDLSSNNAADGAASFNAAAYARAGHRIVGLKVSEGTGYVNPFWREWAAAAIRARLRLVLYHFATDADANAQAVWFAREVKASRLFRHGKDRVFLDIEQGTPLHPTPASPVLFRKDFEATMVIAGFPSLGVYSDAGYLAQYGPGLKPSCGDMWVAAYPNLPAGWWTPAWAHQYTQTGQVRGVVGLVDVSQLRRTFFQRLLRKGIA